MNLTVEQKKIAEANIGLVGKVIKDRVYDVNNLGFYSYDDIFQIGCIGLCKAAATDKGSGCFSTYAYRLIWNEICDALIYSSRRQKTQHECEDEQLDSISASDTFNNDTIELKQDLRIALEKAKLNTSDSVAKGIDALMLMNEGYTAREIGEKFGAAPNLVTAFVSKARRFLKTNPELLNLYAYGKPI